jgi:flagellar biosynthesis protein FlhF
VVGDAVLPPAPAPPARIEKAPPQPRVEIPASSPQIVSANTAWAVEFERLRMDLASLHAIVSKGFSKTDAADPGVQLHGQLVQHGIDADLAAEWVKAVEPAARAGSWTRPAVRDALVEQLSSRVRVDASLGWDSTQDKAIMLVGPAGSGKTTALLKLALEFGVKRGRDVELWTLDNQSGDVDPMVQSFARLLNLPSRQFRSARTLAASFEGVSSGKSLVLVDTTGSWGTSVDGDQELSQVLGSASRIDCQLVLPAAWQPSAVAKAVDRFEVFQPSRLLFSMLDHTCVWGAMLQEPWRTSKALSFLGEGAMGSGSMQASSVARILDRIFEPAE